MNKRFDSDETDNKSVLETTPDLTRHSSTRRRLQPSLSSSFGSRRELYSKTSGEYNKPQRRKKKKWYVHLLKGCGFQSRRKKEKLAMAVEADQLFWATFYRAYDALCTPVILGEIERKTLDVRIVYANAAACDFTGYSPGEISWKNPNGMIGRSITDLMEDNLSDAHAGFVEGWLHRRGIIKTRSESSIYSTTDSEISFTSNRRIMKKVEGISRRVTIVTKDDRLLSADAALSFFTAKGLKKVIGIFSFKSAEKLEVVSFEGLSFNLQYRQDFDSDVAHYVVVVPPATVSEFSLDEQWQITAVSNGIILSETDRTAIKELIRNQIFYHLSKISYGSGLDVTYVEKDLHALSKSRTRQAHVNLVNAMNASKSEKNMHILAVLKSKGTKQYSSSGSGFYGLDLDEDDEGEDDC